MARSSVITIENTDGIIPSVKLSREFFFGALPVFNTISVWFFLFPTKLATEQRITDDQYSGRRIPSVMPSVKMLPTNCVSYTNRMNPSVKLFNGVIEKSMYL